MAVTVCVAGAGAALGADDVALDDGADVDDGEPVLDVLDWAATVGAWELAVELPPLSQADRDRAKAASPATPKVFFIDFS